MRGQLTARRELRRRFGAPFLPVDILWSLAAVVVGVMLSVVAVNPRWAAMISQRLRGLEAWITGNERGLDVLAGKESGRAGALTVTVNQILLTPHFTRIVVTVSNNGFAPMVLPGAGNWRLLTHDGAVLQGSALRSLWPDAVPAHWSVAGIVTFDRLPEDTGGISLGLGGVADAGAGALTLANIRLRAV
ncbi:MAG TPA: hypothetical protein VFC19_52725 [Candidatus Limnocylindrales bacterium]|nr:hypothetical protein [Candidatus Limnocylindrales bacterium]